MHCKIGRLGKVESNLPVCLLTTSLCHPPTCLAYWTAVCQCPVALAAGRLASGRRAAAQRARAAGKPRNTALALWARAANARRVPERSAASLPRRSRSGPPRSLGRPPSVSTQHPTVRFGRVRECAAGSRGRSSSETWVEHRDGLLGFAGPWRHK